MLTTPTTGAAKASSAETMALKLSKKLNNDIDTSTAALVFYKLVPFPSFFIYL
jgi:hypothetical protein